MDAFQYIKQNGRTFFSGYFEEYGLEDFSDNAESKYRDRGYFSNPVEEEFMEKYGDVEL